MICCIKYLEKTLKNEAKLNMALAVSWTSNYLYELLLYIKIDVFAYLQPTRQHFLDRLVWCLSQLKATVALTDDEAALATAMEMEPSFVGYMDMVLDILQPLSIYSAQPYEQSNVAEMKAEV